MLLRRANKYRAEPSPYQAQAMGQWVGACRHEYNHALERRQYEYRNYGFSLAYVPQAKELTVRRAAKNWLEFVPIHALQNALRDLDEAFSRFFKKLCGHPTPRKKVQERLLHAAGGGRRVQATQQTPRRHQASQDRLGSLPRIPTSRRRPPLGHLPPEGRRVVR